VLLDGVEALALADPGAQVSTIAKRFCHKMGYKIMPLGDILEVENMGGGLIAYSGFVELNLQIPNVSKYAQDDLFLVIPDSRYNVDVPVALGTRVINGVVDVIQVEEVVDLSDS
jgi:hypothetical protein